MMVIVTISLHLKCNKYLVIMKISLNLKLIKKLSKNKNIISFDLKSSKN